MRKISCLLTVLLLLFCAGCVSNLPDDGTTTQVPSSSSTAPKKTAPSTATSSKATDPVQTTVPIDENIAFFTDLFTYYYNPVDTEFLFGRNFYNTAMCCEFSRPEELPLDWFFYNGLTRYDLTEEEKALIVDYLGKHRLVPEEMNEVLEAYFDITLDDIDWDVVYIFYWDKTGCYYTASSDLLLCDFVIHAVEELENGIFKIKYYNDILDGDYVITLQSRASNGGEGFRILSNLPV